MSAATRSSEVVPSSDVRFAILDVVYKYCELMDRFEFEEMARQVFAQDASENHGLGLPTVHGRQEIAQLFTTLMQPYDGSMHNVSNTRFEEGPNGLSSPGPISGPITGSRQRVRTRCGRSTC